MTDPLNELNERIDREVTDRYAQTSYTDSYVAFLDIMGMKELVQRPYEEIRTIFNAAESGRTLYGRIEVPGGRNFISDDHLRMTIMSDAIVLSIDAGIDYAFAKLVGFSSYLINRLLTALEIPVFLRGGIVRGEIYHDGNTVFGPALVAAYRLESEVAISMRCIISSDLEQDAMVRTCQETSGSALTRDPEDGMWFIAFVRSEVRDRLQSAVRRVLNSAANADLKEKYQWLRRYLERDGYA